MCLYLDDSGTRHPDRDAGKLPAHNRDWFGLGGVLLRESDEDAVRAKHAALCTKWQIKYPLHSAEIRASSNHFTWVKQLEPDKKAEFMQDLTALATTPELIAIACVIDRPGYNHRYRERYGRARWDLCKTAFGVVVERAAKLARENGCRLRVYVERADKKTDATLLDYYNRLRANGHPFHESSASKYNPLAVEEFHETLYEFRTKNKTSPPMQIADLCLWPICIGGYDTSNRAYVALKESGTLIDTRIPPEDVPSRGIKYSCWDLVAEKDEARS